MIRRLLEVYPDLDPDQIRLTKDQLTQIIRSASDSAFRMAKSVSLVCDGNECPYRNMCLYYKVGIAPVGEPCMEEVVLIQQTLPQLIRDFQIDLEDSVEHDMVQEYMDAVVTEHRSRKDIALTGQVVESVTTVDPTTGQPYYEKKENPVLAVKERALKRKDRIRKDFIKTREQRARYQVGNPEDESSLAADIRTRMEQSRERHPSEDIQDAEFEDVTDE